MIFVYHKNAVGYATQKANNNINSLDNIAAVASRRYFNDASNMLGVRDLIIVRDTARPTTHFCTSLSNTDSVVDVSYITAVAETDDDE